MMYDKIDNFMLLKNPFLKIKKLKPSFIFNNKNFF